jgi:hypothetical protein
LIAKFVERSAAPALLGEAGVDGCAATEFTGERPLVFGFERARRATSQTVPMPPATTAISTEWVAT